MTEPLPFAPDEAESVALPVKWVCLGSRVAGVVTVPHLPGPDAPRLVEDRHRWRLPAELIANGAPGGDWADDPAIGCWAEAAHPQQDAVRVVEAGAAGRGLVSVAVTRRRLVVMFPRKLLADAPDTRPRGMFGRPKGNRTDWAEGDIPHIQFSVPQDRIAGYHTALVGRSIPAPRFLAVTFTDGSVLFVRCDKPDPHVEKIRALTT
ncbi:hypothetical protein [Actinokineospora globicatena]|uniref:hypothetical protein n=1 Tax=Actinokineospora globicatena TaxID=103729 RepID=UPI0020A3683D|nr:hypothetical protein [Actinokineospora globicatena]MCP2306801.1 hypothetical protein [Actinokineospora globicatena]